MKREIQLQCWLKNTKIYVVNSFKYGFQEKLSENIYGRFVQSYFNIDLCCYDKISKSEPIHIMLPVQYTLLENQFVCLGTKSQAFDGRDLS